MNVDKDKPEETYTEMQLRDSNVVLIQSSPWGGGGS